MSVLACTRMFSGHVWLGKGKGGWRGGEGGGGGGWLSWGILEYNKAMPAAAGPARELALKVITKKEKVNRPA